MFRCSNGNGSVRSPICDALIVADERADYFSYCEVGFAERVLGDHILTMVNDPLWEDHGISLTGRHRSEKEMWSMGVRLLTELVSEKHSFIFLCFVMDIAVPRRPNRASMNSPH